MVTLPGLLLKPGRDLPSRMPLRVEAIGPHVKRLAALGPVEIRDRVLHRRLANQAGARRGIETLLALHEICANRAPSLPLRRGQQSQPAPHLPRPVKLQEIRAGKAISQQLL